MPGEARPGVPFATIRNQCPTRNSRSASTFSGPRPRLPPCTLCRLRHRATRRGAQPKRHRTLRGTPGGRRGDPDRGRGRRHHAQAARAALHAALLRGARRARGFARLAARGSGRSARGHHLGSGARHALRQRHPRRARRALDLALPHAARADDQLRGLHHRAVRGPHSSRRAVDRGHRGRDRRAPEGQGEPARGPRAPHAQHLLDRHRGRRRDHQRAHAPHARRRAPARRPRGGQRREASRSTR